MRDRPGELVTASVNATDSERSDHRDTLVTVITPRALASQTSPTTTTALADPSASKRSPQESPPEEACPCPPPPPPGASFTLPSPVWPGSVTPFIITLTIDGLGYCGTSTAPSSPSPTPVLEDASNQYHQQSTTPPPPPSSGPGTNPQADTPTPPSPSPSSSSSSSSSVGMPLGPPAQTTPSLHDMTTFVTSTTVAAGPTTTTAAAVAAAAAAFGYIKGGDGRGHAINLAKVGLPAVVGGAALLVGVFLAGRYLHVGRVRAREERRRAKGKGKEKEKDAGGDDVVVVRGEEQQAAGGGGADGEVR